MRIDELIVYRIDKDEQVLNDISYIIDCYEKFGQEFDPDDYIESFYSCMQKLIDMAGNHGFHGNLWHCYLTNVLVNHENSYSRATEIVGSVEGSINDAVLHDIAIFKELYDYKFNDLISKLSIKDFDIIENYNSGTTPSKVYNQRIMERICTLAEKFNNDNTPQQMKDTLTAFYKDYGVGRFGLHKAFRVVENDGKTEIVPILNITHVKLDDLVGYEIAKKKLTDNTEAFVNGRKANNCLLFGDAGTGKSSSIKAIANAYYDKGLRIIEIYKHQFKMLNDVIAQIKNRNYKFIIFMDDLSFEDFEIEYKYLKAVIEGGLEKKPSNVLIYATSNRRHIVNETISERENNMHVTDTLQEKLSLVARFGVTIYFGSPDKKEYQNIVRVLAARNNIDVSDDKLMAEANKWEMSHGGFSGRSAQQFIDYLLGTFID
jgi:predicted AAA+ superfamily ATPase